MSSLCQTIVEIMIPIALEFPQVVLQRSGAFDQTTITLMSRSYMKDSLEQFATNLEAALMEMAALMR